MRREVAPEKKSGLDLFRQEIAGLKDVEMRKKEEFEKRQKELKNEEEDFVSAEEIKKDAKKFESYNPHFENINPKDLAEEDRQVYAKFKDNSLTYKEFMAYRDKVLAYAKEKYILQKDKTPDRSVETDTRMNFYAWLDTLTIGEKKWREKFRKEMKEAEKENK